MGSLKYFRHSQLLMSRRHERRHLSSIIYLALAISVLGLLMVPLAAAFDSPTHSSEDFTGFTLDVPPTGWTISDYEDSVVCDATNSIPTCGVTPPTSFPHFVSRDAIAPATGGTAISPSFTCDDTCVLDFEFYLRFDDPANVEVAGLINWGSGDTRMAFIDWTGAVDPWPLFLCSLLDELESCTDTGSTVSGNVYHTYQMTHDNVAGTLELRLDGVLVGTRNIDTVTITTLEIEGTAATNRGSEWAIDDIVVTATSQAGGGGGGVPPPGEPDDGDGTDGPADFEWEPLDATEDSCDSSTRTLVYTDMTIAEQTALLYIWDFGDGTGTVVVKTPTIEHFYAEVGTYTVEHAVTFVDGSIYRASAVVEVGFCSVSFITGFAPNIAIGIFALSGVLWMSFAATRRPSRLVFALVATFAGVGTWAFAGFSGLATITAGITTATVALAAVLWAAFVMMRRPRLLVYALIATMAAIMAFILG